MSDQEFETELELVSVESTPAYDFTNFQIEQSILGSIKLREKLTELRQVMREEILSLQPQHVESLRLSRQINGMLESLI